MLKLMASQHIWNRAVPFLALKIKAVSGTKSSGALALAPDELYEPVYERQDLCCVPGVHDQLPPAYTTYGFPDHVRRTIHECPDHPPRRSATVVGRPEEGGVCPKRQYDGHIDTAGVYFPVQGQPEPPHTELGSGVRRALPCCDDPGKRRDEHDVPPASLQHSGQKQIRESHGREQVYLHELLPPRHGHLMEVAVRDDACVVHEDVDVRYERRTSGVERLAAFLVGQVRTDRADDPGTAFAGSDGIVMGHLVEHRCVPPGKDDVRSRLQELPRKLPAEAAGRAGDEYCFPAQIALRHTSLLWAHRLYHGG